MAERRNPYITAEPYLPAKISLRSMEAAVQGCRGCDLYMCATQAVFGDGPALASCMIVGEQPGNEEDLKGEPFVGPAGRLLDRALEEAGIKRESVYLTNAVKHFKNELRGTRRLHRSPDSAEIAACRPWLSAETKVIKPKVLVCLGVSAARSVFNRSVTIKELRGNFHQSELCELTLVTTHPSAILRSPDDETRHTALDSLVRDLKLVNSELGAKS